jgi:hypothetical protein
MRLLTSAVFCLTLVLAGCSGNAGTAKSDDTRVVPAGEEATVGHLTFSVVDSQILTQLGDEATPRIPRDRFIVVQIAVSNSSNVDNPIPGIELVSDSGRTYDELTDGTGVTNWLGIVRHVGPNQTERGEIAFDAPAAHYKLKFSDESMEKEILADLPLSYSHEKLNDSLLPNTDLPDVPAPAPALKTK